jgi:hypothetical protein
MTAEATFARRVFLLAGIAGLLVIVPLFFALDYIGQQYPPAVNHPEYYYDFLAITLAWQVAFLIIARDPVRFRPLMIGGMLEKAGHITAMTTMFAAGHILLEQLITGAILDAILLVLFVMAYQRTPVE